MVQGQRTRREETAAISFTTGIRSTHPKARPCFRSRERIGFQLPLIGVTRESFCR